MAPPLTHWAGRGASIGGVGPARLSQKLATRNRVIEAARQLFGSEGYEGATIRQIARHAGVSVGSVFTTFHSKGEVLSQVIQDLLGPAYAELERLAPHLRGSTRDRLCSMFAIHFAAELPHARLFLAHIAAAYDRTEGPEARSFGHDPCLADLIRACLARGVAEGDVAATSDLQEIIDLLMAAFAWTHRLGADAADMTAAMDRKIALIADGFRPR
jgi:AcrR family transcriptional regulator